MRRYVEVEESDSLLLKNAVTGNSLAASFFLLLAYMLGSGFLTQAYVFKESGLAVAPFIYTIAVSGCYFGSTFLLDVMGSRRVFDYALVAGDVLGDFGWASVHIANITMTIGCVLSYFILLGSMLQSVISTFGGGDTAWYTDLYFLTALCVVVLTPLTSFTHFSEMIWLAVTTVTMLVTGFCYIMVEGSETESTYDTLSITVASATGTLDTVGFVMFAMGVSIVVPVTYVNSENTDRAAFDKVLLGSQVFGGVFLFVDGLAAYMFFRSDTDVNIMDNFTGTAAAILKCIVMTHLLTYIPGCTVVGRNSMYALLGTNVSDVSYLNILCVSGLVLTATGLVAVLLSEYFGTSTALSNVINVTGGISAAFLCFGMPGLLVLKSEVADSDLWTFYGAWSLVILSIVAALMVTLSIVYE
jgi:amino acid permease